MGPSGRSLLAVAGLGLAGSFATGPDGRALPGLGPGNRTLLPEIVSQAPVVYRFDDVLDARECAMIRRLLIDAIVFFNDTARDGSARDGARAFPLGHENRPRYRMQNREQLSLYFENPPPIMQELYSRIAKLQNIHVSNIEAIYHLYAPGGQAANLHMDNFNKFLFPHRFASSSMFFDDYEDGGTVFPLLVPQDPEKDLLNTSVAADTAEVMRWHAQINASRETDDPHSNFAGRRVMADETDAFRRRALQEARERCSRAGSARDPVTPKRGSVYIWRNYLANGEDDVRSLHAGCHSSKSIKLLGTFFFRDWPGPFEQHQSFWDPLEDMLGGRSDEQRRVVEAQQMETLRHVYLAELYDEQRFAARDLAGWPAAAWTARRQLRHWKSLMYHKTQQGLMDTLWHMQTSGEYTDDP